MVQYIFDISNLLRGWQGENRATKDRKIKYSITNGVNKSNRFIRSWDYDVEFD
jgi:hypothetical protein